MRGEREARERRERDERETRERERETRERERERDEERKGRRERNTYIPYLHKNRYIHMYLPTYLHTGAGKLLPLILFVVCVKTSAESYPLPFILGVASAETCPLATKVTLKVSC